MRGYSPLKKRERKLRFYVYKISATPLFRCSSRAPFRAHTYTSGPKSIHNGIGAVNATGPPSGSSLHCSGLLVKVHIKKCVHMSNFFAVENVLLMHKTHATLDALFGLQQQQLLLRSSMHLHLTRIGSMLKTYSCHTKRAPERGFPPHRLALQPCITRIISVNRRKKTRQEINNSTWSDEPCLPAPHPRVRKAV